MDSRVIKVDNFHSAPKFPQMKLNVILQFSSASTWRWMASLSLSMPGSVSVCLSVTFVLALWFGLGNLSLLFCQALAPHLLFHLEANQPASLTFAWFFVLPSSSTASSYRRLLLLYFGRSSRRMMVVCGCCLCMGSEC